MESAAQCAAGGPGGASLSRDWGSFSQRVATIQALSRVSGDQWTQERCEQPGRVRGHEDSSDNIMVSVIMVTIVSVVMCEPE